MTTARGRQRLAERFKEMVASGALDAVHRRRWGRLAEFHAWLERDRLPSLSGAEAMALYRASGGREAEAFASNPIAEVRDSLDFLLYDETKLEGRFEEAARPEGGYGLRGGGRELCSYALAVKDPALFGVWDASADRGLKAIGLTPPYTDSAFGVQYVDTLNALWEVRGLLGLGDFVLVDLLMHGLASRKLQVSEELDARGP